MIRNNSFQIAAFIFREDVHDAWRSTVLPEGYLPSDDPVPLLAKHAKFAAHDIWNSPDARDLCRYSSLVVLAAVASHVQSEEDLTSPDVYRMMEHLYCHYQIRRVQQELARDQGLPVDSVPTQNVLSNLIQNDSIGGPQGCDYGSKSPDYKEKDRRIVLAGFATLLHPLSRIAFWDKFCRVDQVLERPGIHAAAVDGLAILSSVRNGQVYNPDKSFASDATLFQY